LKISGYVLSSILHGKQIKNRSKNEMAGVGWRSREREREKTRQRSVLSLIGRCDKIKVECSPYMPPIVSAFCLLLFSVRT
jgi:hypothetical protein